MFSLTLDYADIRFFLFPVYIVKTCVHTIIYNYICISVDEASKSRHLFTEIYDNIPDDSRNNDVAVELINTLWRF